MHWGPDWQTEASGMHTIRTHDLDEATFAVSQVYCSHELKLKKTERAIDTVARCGQHVDGTPFGGYKESGIGREYCRETLHMYTHLKSITWVDRVPPPWFLSPPS
jgi:hypothetical protein